MKKLGFGMMRLPLKDENDFSSVNQEEVNKMADKFIESGFTYFDTAYPYHNGQSEVVLRKAVVERYPRDSFQIADKLPLFLITKEEELEPIFNEQLERCGVNYFDYYLLHNASPYSEAGFIEVNSFEFAIKKKKEGKIKHLGLSSHANAEYIEKLLIKYPEMEFIQLQINYLDWKNEAIDAKKCFEVARKYELPIIIMEPLKGGFLANLPKEAEMLMKEYNDENPVSWAYKYCANLEGVLVVLSGASNIEQLEENIRIFENLNPITDKQEEILDEVIKIINNNIAVECTKCNYCITTCPKNIDIPKLFDMYNNQKIENIETFTAVGNAYVNYSKLKDKGIASDCISCGLCVKECPQHINIPEVMKDVKETFEVALYGFTND